MLKKNLLLSSVIAAALVVGFILGLNAPILGKLEGTLGACREAYPGKDCRLFWAPSDSILVPDPSP